MFNKGDRDRDRDRDSRRDGKDKKDKGARRSSMQQHKRTCKFCADKELRISYRNEKMVLGFVNERGKILQRRYTGACATHQRDINIAVKRARILALVPFTATQVR